MKKKRNSISRIAILALITLFSSVEAQAALISQSQELRMGQDAARQIESQYPVSNDPYMNSLITGMGQRLASVSARPNLPWRFEVLNVSDINASSVPAYVFVNRGLIDFTGNDRDALAGVVAHEVAHTAAKHAVKSVEEQLKYSLILGLLFRGGTAAQLGNIAANLALLGYSRKDEYEADRLGVDYMAAAGYNPNGMLRFFRALQQRERDPRGLSVYFQTHPPTSGRIVRVRQEMMRIGIQPTV